MSFKWPKNVKKNIKGPKKVRNDSISIYFFNIQFDIVIIMAGIRFRAAFEPEKESKLSADTL